jgi:hypothetical protein
MNVLIDSIEQAYQDREDFFVGGNMFIYFSRERVFNKDFRCRFFRCPRYSMVVINDKDGWFGTKTDVIPM